MKIKKIMLLLIVFIVALVIFMPKANAGGGQFWDVITGDIYAEDGIIGNERWFCRDFVFENEEEAEKYFGSKGEIEIYFESEDFNEYIAELNKYMPKGVTLTANNNKTYDVYLNNVNCEYLSFYGGWSGNLYLSGKNNIERLRLITEDIDQKVNIIGNGISELNVNYISFDGNMTFKNCNINISPINSEDEINFFAEQVILEGRVKIEIAPNTKISGTTRTLFEENTFKNFLGEQYNTEYEIRESTESPYGSYCSPEAIIIKNYEDVELLEQSVEKINAGEGLIFRFDKEIEKFEELYINGNLLTKDVDYTIESGSTIVKLSEEYTKKLPAGNYEVKAMFTDGEGTAKFEVAKVEETVVAEPVTEKTEAKPERTLDKTPKTGYENYNNYYIVLSVVTIIALGIILKSKIK